MSTTALITRDEFLKLWQGHRGLTRRVIEKFPEKELFNFTIGGMRTFAEIAKELLTIGLPGLIGIVNKTEDPLSHEISINSKEEMLKMWDEQTPLINEYFNKIKDEEFHEVLNLFGSYKNANYGSLFYFLNHEILHRGQGYVYLRSLGIEPPFFWEH